MVILYLGRIGEKRRNEKLSEIRKESGYTKGFLVRIFYYKNKTLTAKYVVKGVEYEYDGAWDHNPEQLRVGDSIMIKYSLKNPSVAITQLDNNY